MTDNIILSTNVGIGETVASDDIDGVQHTRAKLIFGNDGVNEGDVSTTNPLPIDIKNQPVKVISENLIWKAGSGKVSVGDTSTLVMAANAARQGATFINDSPNVIYLRIGSPAVLNEGKRLNANGGSYEMNNTNLSTLAVNAISAVAASNLAIEEAGT